MSRGIIPAGAGKSEDGDGVDIRPWDHPRGCGEKPEGDAGLVWVSGSSPRVRGKVGLSRSPRSTFGIIPAGAGKSFFAILPGRIDGDHPRGCGEKAARRTSARSSIGSSPRVRGKASSSDGCRTSRGIIPAGAGKSMASSCLRRGGWDHPRGCGEKRAGSPRARGGRGSSPRVRGKGGGAQGAGLSAGIIPAGAGKRLGDPGGLGVLWDHPRGCGEKTITEGYESVEEGSSPRVRGKVSATTWAFSPDGIIPAGAGKSRGVAADGLGDGDHPRGCGEKSFSPRP